MKRHDDPRAASMDWSDVRARLEKVQATVLASLAEDPGEIAAQLKVRARHLARPEVDTADGAGTVELVLFDSGTSRYGIDTRFVHRIMKAPHVTPIAGVPRPFLGVIAGVGQVLPVVSIERLFGDGKEAVDPMDCLVLILGEAGPEIGLLATRVDRVARVPVPSIRTMPEAGPEASFVTGVSEDGTAFIDGRLLLTDPRLAPVDSSRVKSRNGGTDDGPPHGGGK